MNRYQLFKSFHHTPEGLFLGNVHDVLSSVILEKVGFKAIGTTSWGVANTFGYRDGQRINFRDYLYIIKKIVASVNIPVSVDIEAGFSGEPNDVCENVLMIADLGAVGINIEDSLKDSSGLLLATDRQCELISKIRNQLEKKGYKDFFINARTDTYLCPVSNDRLEESVKRGQQYAQHGADGFFVPCLIDEKSIAVVAQEVPLPLNLMSLPQLVDFNRLRRLNVKRFSFGNALSDYMISSAEKVAKQVLSDENTAVLFQHAAIETIFK